MKLKAVSGKNFAFVFLILLLVANMAMVDVGANPEIFLSVEPPEQVVPAGLTFTINITVTNITDLWCMEFKLWYNSTLIEATDVIPGPVMKTTSYIEAVEDLTVPGRVWYGWSFLAKPSFNGTGVVAKVNFTATAVGESVLHLNETLMGSTAIVDLIPHTTVDGTVEVRHARSLTIHSLPTGVTFTVDGVSRTTPWSGTYSEGASVNLEMPETHDGYVFSHWLEDGDTNRTKTITMDTDITLTASYTRPPPPVGGKAIPINTPTIKPELQIPWIWLSAIILPLIATAVFLKLKKKKQ